MEFIVLTFVGALERSRRNEVRHLLFSLMDYDVIRLSSMILNESMKSDSKYSVQYLLTNSLFRYPMSGAAPVKMQLVVLILSDNRSVIATMTAMLDSADNVLGSKLS